MPGFLLHVGATVMCVHPPGQAQPMVSNLRVKVSGQPIVTQPKPHSVTGCLFNVGGSLSPCVTAQWITAATRVRAGGEPVLLKDSQAICTPNGTGVNIVMTQTRVKGT
jgi:hypothetical protein